MTTNALQKRIIEKVSLTKNKSVLEKLDSILNEEVYRFSEFQQKILEENQVQYTKGNFSTSEEMTEQVEEWAKK